MSSNEVQVEARTLSGVHIGQRVNTGLTSGVLFEIHHLEGAKVIELVYADLNEDALWPTDLVTLTDGGAR